MSTATDIYEAGVGNFDPEGIEFDPERLARAMMQNDKSLSPREIREAKVDFKRAKLNGLHSSELAGRGFNKMIQSLPMKYRHQFACCYYCGDELTRENRNLDHIYPASKGGKITVPSCLTCNIRKKDWEAEEFRIRNFGKMFVFWGESVVARGLDSLRSSIDSIQDLN